MRHIRSSFYGFEGRKLDPMPPRLNKLAASLSLGVLGSVFLLPEPASALDSCTAGQRVLTPARVGATVTAVSGSACTIRRDDNGLSETYSAFMLDSATPGPRNTSPGPAGRPGQTNAPASQSAGAVAPAIGTYQCTSPTSGNLVIRILPNNRYANQQNSTGNFTINRSGQLSFVTGPLAGMYGRTLDGGRLGLTSQPAGSFYAMTCDRRS